MEAQLEYVHIACTFCTFGIDLYAHLALMNKISVSVLSRKFIKGPLLVGLFFFFLRQSLSAPFSYSCKLGKSLLEQLLRNSPCPPSFSCFARLADHPRDPHFDRGLPHHRSAGGGEQARARPAQLHHRPGVAARPQLAARRRQRPEGRRPPLRAGQHRGLQRPRCPRPPGPGQGDGGGSRRRAQGKDN